MICGRNQFKQGQVEVREEEPSMYKNMDEDNKEDGHQHKHAGLCADEIGMRHHSYFLPGSNLT